MLCRGLLRLPRWKSSGGRDFVFYHSFPGLSLGSEQADANFAAAMCNNFQWATLLAAEQVHPLIEASVSLYKLCELVWSKLDW